MAKQPKSRVFVVGVGMTEVNNACASSSTAVHLAKQFIETRDTDVVLAVGFEKRRLGSLDTMKAYNDRVDPVDKHINVVSKTLGLETVPMTSQYFGNATREHMEVYGTKPEHFAKAALKSHRHAQHNPRAQFQQQYSLDEILVSRTIHWPFTKLQCSPTSDGSAAAILCSEKYLKSHNWLSDRAVEIIGQVV